MAYKNFVVPIPLSSIASSTVSGTYQLLSAATGIPAACTQLRIVNASSEDVTISYDGTHDHDYVPSDTQLNLQFQANSLPQGYAALLRQFTMVYVKGTAGTGNVYLAGFYQPTDT